MIPMYVAMHNAISGNIYTCTDGLEDGYFVVSHSWKNKALYYLYVEDYKKHDTFLIDYDSCMLCYLGTDP